ncbi:PGF-pre-PGF domain-containing protein [Methanococcoides sp. SA1]|nr:PGF-pre-PGF domain-containing protein [Methanococcoides sp. SA1]
MILLPMSAVGAIGNNSSIDTEAEQYYILQFKGSVLNQWESELVNSGVNIVDYLPGNSFIVRVNSSRVSEIEDLDFVLKVDEYQTSVRDALETNDEDRTFSILGTTQKDVFLVVIFDSSDMIRISSQIEDFGGVILDSSPNRMKVEIISENAGNIASIPGISLIEKSVELQFFNDVVTGILNVDLAHNNHGLNGSGEIVAVCDTGIDTGVNDSTMHADLRGRIINITDFSNNGSADWNGHGTHVAGSVLGNGNLSGGQYKGMAPESMLVFQAVENSDRSLAVNSLYLSELFQPAYDLGARIHTNSWGAATNGEYTDLSDQVDDFSWHHPDMLIIFAAGNEGIDSNGDGVIDLDSISSPGTAKNCLTVGASENDRPSFSDTWGYNWASKFSVNPIRDDLMANNTEGIAAFSSRGPTDDGRIKPDVVAPGTYIASTRSSVSNTTGWGIIGPNYLYMGGTSMSAPIVAGTAALVRQYYNETEDLQNPSAALIKATLIHHAHDMTPGQYGIDSTQEVQSKPDYSQGWGRVDIAGMMDPQYPEVSVYFDKINLNTSESWNVSYGYIKAGENVSATLVWTDYPGNSLVNNLDLALKTNDSTYFGNGGSESDTTNNVERIEFNAPASDTYMIYVNGTSVTTTSQGQNFSMLTSFVCDLNEFPQNGSYSNNGTTGLSIVHPDGVNVSSVNMSVDNTPINFSNASIVSGYTIQNDTILSYTNGIHTVSVNALTNKGKNISFDWSFYYDGQSPVITIVEPVEKEVFQTNTFKINISTDKSGDIWYNINNGVNTSLLSTTSLIDTLVLDEGHYTLNAFALDNANNFNFTVFTAPSVDTPSSGTIFYIPNSDIEVNGTAGVANNISVYVNGAITNTSSVSSGLFNVSGIPISNGKNIINISSSFNNSENDYFSSNVSFNVILGETLNATEHMELHVPGWVGNASNPLIDFNVSGISATIPDNISVALSAVPDPQNSHTLAGPMLDIRVLNESDPNYSYVFDQIVSLTLGYDALLVNDTARLVLAWYDPAAQMWIPLKSAINATSMSVSANLTHLSVYAPLEDDLAPVISNLASSVSLSSVTLSWDNSEDTDHVEIWRDNSSLINSSDSGITDSGLSSGIFYTYQLRPVDYAGNIGNWSYINATTSKKSTSSSSGGSSGGGGSTTNEYFENIYHKEVVTEYISRDVENTFMFKEDAHIDYITLLADSNVGSVKAIVEVLINTSTLVQNEPDGEVYQNLNIWVGNYGLKKNIISSSVGFKVSDAWIEENGIDADSISMKMYYNDAWVVLPTEIIGEDGEYIYYETYAGINLLAPFAIVGQLLDDGTDSQLSSSNSNSIAGISSLNEGSSTISDEDRGHISGIFKGFIYRITDLFSKLFGN